MKNDCKMDTLGCRPPYELGIACHGWNTQLIPRAKNDFVRSTDTARFSKRYGTCRWSIGYDLHAVQKSLRSRCFFRPSNAQETSKLLSGSLRHNHLLSYHVRLEVMSDSRMLCDKGSGRASVDIHSPR